MILNYMTFRIISPNLEFVFMAILLTIKPKSVESKRVFSLRGGFATIIKVALSRLKANTLSTRVDYKKHFVELKENDLKLVL